MTTPKDYQDEVLKKLLDMYDNDKTVKPDFEALELVTRLDLEPPWKSGEVHPLDAALFIDAMFDGEVQGDVLVFAHPTTEPDPATRAWVCYRINRNHAMIMSTKSAMPRETYIGRLTDEYAALLEDEDEDDDEGGEPEPGASAAPAAPPATA